MVDEGLPGEAVTLDDVAQRLLDCYPAFMEVEPYSLRRAFPSLSLASCQDVAQEAFLRVGRKAATGSLAAETNLMAHLRRAARNLAVDWCDEQQRRMRLALRVGEALAAVPEGWASADERPVVLDELVIPAIEAMPESLRRQVVDLQSQGLSDGQIANVLDISALQLHNLRNKAIVELRRRLAGHIRDGHRKKPQHVKRDR